MFKECLTLLKRHIDLPVFLMGQDLFYIMSWVFIYLKDLNRSSLHTAGLCCQQNNGQV